MTIDVQRRKAVMARSIKLGHCVCNPKKPCPCDIFREYNICQCAGEKMPVKTGDVPLTKHVRKAGCASKIGQADLLRILSKLPEVTDPNVLVGTAAGDDAGVYKLDDRYALVQTVDVFTPCVDDAYLFGQIAAANSVSDVYAMGGRPLTALSIIGFPIDELDGSIMEEMLRGGMDKLEEAGCSLIGGHSINDEEVKLGFAVTGLMDSENAVQRDNAHPGDVLVLTKPLGTGMVSFAAQIGRISQECLDEVGASMAELNKDAAELMVKHGANACTDVTGYALAGHLVEMVRGSGVTAEIDMSRLPVFAAARACLENDILPGAIERNQEYSMAWVKVTDTGGEKNLPILYDPQTSGGLLISLPEEQGNAFVEEMRERGHDSTSVIGRIVEKDGGKSDGEILVINAKLANFIGNRQEVVVMAKEEKVPSSAPVEQPAAAESLDFSCCDSPPDLESLTADSAPHAAAEGSAVDALAKFKDFMKEANKPGRIDARNKKLMAIALSIAQRCRPCLNIHMQGAIKMGISKEEIDEVATLVTAFGGCTAMMFYKEVCEELGL
jgi:selenide,water dikinase